MVLTDQVLAEVQHFPLCLVITLAEVTDLLPVLLKGNSGFWFPTNALSTCWLSVLGYMERMGAFIMLVVFRNFEVAVLLPLWKDSLPLLLAVLYKEPSKCLSCGLDKQTILAIQFKGLRWPVVGTL